MEYDVLMIDAMPMSLSIETAGGVATRILARNSHIPNSNDYTFYTNEDNQTAANIRVLEGERPMSKDNRLIGAYELIGIPPKPRGAVKIKVVYNVNRDGILTVEAKELETGRSINVTVDNHADRISKEDMTRMIVDAEDNFEADRKIRMRNNLRISLYDTCYGLRNSIAEKEEKIAMISQDKKYKCSESALDIIKWIDDHPDTTVEELREKEKELKSVVDTTFGWK
jgi:molecular chaperone DnaK (HSP70)